MKMKKESRGTPARADADWPARLAEMSDAGIATLLSNANRLRAGGSDAAQAMAASDLLPAIEEEMAQRKARRAAKSVKKTPKARTVPVKQAADS